MCICCVFSDLEQDLNGLRKWLHDVENRLLPLCVRGNWEKGELEAKLKEHQVNSHFISCRLWHPSIFAHSLFSCMFFFYLYKGWCQNFNQIISRKIIQIMGRGGGGAG